MNIRVRGRRSLRDGGERGRAAQGAGEAAAGGGKRGSRRGERHTGSPASAAASPGVRRASRPSRTRPRQFVLSSRHSSGVKGELMLSESGCLAPRSSQAVEEQPPRTMGVREGRRGESGNWWCHGGWSTRRGGGSRAQPASGGEVITHCFTY